jgi:hypothetical protein
VIPAAASLVKYDTPVLISRNSDRKNKVELYRTMRTLHSILMAFPRRVAPSNNLR